MRSFYEFLLEMSFDASVVKTKVRGMVNPINLHLMKLAMYPSSPSRSHWLDDLGTWFNDIAMMDVKPRWRKLSRDTYFNLLYTESLDGISDHTRKLYVNTIQKRYTGVSASFTVDDFDCLRERIKTFHWEMCGLVAGNIYTGDELVPLLERHIGQG